MSDGGRTTSAIRPAHVGRWLLIAILVVATFLVVAIWASGTFESCIHAAQREATAQKNNQGLPALFIFFGGWTGCIGHWTDVNNGPLATFAVLLTGVFTLVLAFSTIGLWRETERLARGADDQSDKLERSIAATKLMAANIARTQRPYVTIKSLQLIYTKLEPSPDEENAVEKASVTFEAVITNVGKGPAFPLRGDFKGEVGPRPRSVTGFTGFRTPRIFIGEILPEGGTLSVPRLSTVTHTEKLMAPFVARDSTFTAFFIGGRIIYRDIFGITRETGFRFIHSRGRGHTELAFYPTGGSEHWFDREIPEDGDA